MTRKDLYFAARKIMPKRLLQSMVREFTRSVNWLKYRDRHFFLEVSLEISTHCNRRCVYCPQSVDALPAEFMSWELLIAVMQRLKDIGWSGPVSYNNFNEPLLDKRLPDIVKLTKAWLPRSMPKVYTNGDRLTEGMFLELVDAGIVNFAVTHHSYSEDAGWKNILMLAKKYPNFFTLETLHGREISNWGGLIEDPELTIQQMPFCEAPETALRVSYKGKVKQCCCDYYGVSDEGDLAEESILEIWNKPSFKQFRKEVLAGVYKRNMCKGCARHEDYSKEQLRTDGAKAWEGRLIKSEPIRKGKFE